MFEPVANTINFSKQEESILTLWKDRQIYEKSLSRRSGSPEFVFYEGPPTANGMPHPGHCLTRAIKDLFPRYRTMRGYHCSRKAGWDTHGLPVEVEVCKELGIHSKEEIESYGVEPFIQLCQRSVWRYMQEWERMTERLGFWIHLDEAYVTYHQSYVESVWWSLKQLFDQGLLYQGHKIVWWWAHGGTALSAGEVGQGYRSVADPSVYVKFPLLDESGQVSDVSLLVWTTTPWTLPSNQFAAVHPDLEYSTIVDPTDTDRKLIVATDLVESIVAKVKKDAAPSWVEKGEQRCLGRELIGRRYVPPFDYYYQSHADDQSPLKSGQPQHHYWRIIAADFVTIESGTGAVHESPAFGEVDYDVLCEENQRFRDENAIQLFCPVKPNGTFDETTPDLAGMWVKDADKAVVRRLKEQGKLYFQEQYVHEYPFCWRAEEDPLIQYPRRSWFIRTTRFKNRMLENNRRINWLPEHIRDGRFGNFLESNVDWALSRERYWGTPLPIWVCSESGKMEAIASYDELLDKPGVRGTEVWQQAKAASPQLVEDLKVHKPYIDAITYDSPFVQGARMSRVSEVIDCWYDSGAMSFAQWGYPHQQSGHFEQQFPADFISEALDQTRGWFYSLLAISTLLFGPGPDADGGDGDSPDGNNQHPFPHPFRNCIVLGLMLGEDGQKMSKSKRNYREPNEIFDRYGADALRWYFFANQPPWTPIRYRERSIKDSIPGFLLRLWNCYSFFVIYANSEDHFDPSQRIDGDVDQLNAQALAKGKGYRAPGERREMDRWILSELNRTAAAVVERMDGYDNFGACQVLDNFVDNLSNWYVRRGRPRFWSREYESADKLDAYWTLYECLLTSCKLIAPFTPFIAEAMWQNLAGVFGGRAAESVHLCDFPTGDASLVDETLSEQMELGRLIVSLGLQARASGSLKVRQPLSKVEVILADQTHQAWLESHRDVVAEELNVKEVEFTDEPDKYIEHRLQPNWRLLGPKLGKLMPKFKQWLDQQSGADLLANLRDNGLVDVTIDNQLVQVTPDELVINISAKPGWTAANDRGVVVVLATELTPELVREGMARDVVRLVQDRRKEMDLQFTDRINVGLVTDSDELRQAIEENSDYIRAETLAVSLDHDAIEAAEAVDREVADNQLTIYIVVAESSPTA